MSAAILVWSITIAQAMLVIAMACYTYRLARGPRAQDRVLCLDAMYVCAMLLVLTMISGARELLTPGAWRKQGSTYRLNSPANEVQRRDHLRSLHAAIRHYQSTHNGQIPPHEYAPEIPPELWRSLDLEGTRMILVNWPATLMVFILPLICTRPPPISVRMTGAVTTSPLPFSKSTIAMRLPTFSRVTC